MTGYDKSKEVNGVEGFCAFPQNDRPKAFPFWLKRGVGEADGVFAVACHSARRGAKRNGGAESIILMFSLPFFALIFGDLDLFC
jgi:hypothetical protein